MTDLHSLQNKFQHFLLNSQIDIQQSIIGTEKVPVTTRLAIYRNAYQARLLESLTSSYPCLKACIGDEEFQRIGFDYINAHPSSFRSIRWFGDQFTHFLDQYHAEQYPYLAEFAEFEWKLTLTFDAADTDIFKLEQISLIPAEAWAHMVLIPHPSLQRMNFFWNVVSIWQRIVKQEEHESPVKNLIPASWILWRDNYINRFYSIPEDEAWAIDGILKGLTFGELCAGLCSFIEESKVGIRAATLLKAWIQLGLISEIRF